MPSAAHYKALARVITSDHDAMGYSIRRIEDMEVPEDLPGEDSLKIGRIFREVPGRELRPRVDVGRFIYKLPDEIKESERTYLWTTYDPEKDLSVMGVFLAPHGES